MATHRGSLSEPTHAQLRAFDHLVADENLKGRGAHITTRMSPNGYLHVFTDRKLFIIRPDGRIPFSHFRRLPA